MAFVIPTIKNLDQLRKQINALFTDLFATVNAWSAVQGFPAAGITLGAVKVLSGSATPEGAVAAPLGSLFLRTDGGATTTLYVKTGGSTGNTGWTAK